MRTAVTQYEIDDETAAPMIPSAGMSTRFDTTFTARPVSMTDVARPGLPRPTR